MLTLNDELWPNGIKKDNQGYAVFYPIGTNKTTIPVASSDWPTGDKLISPFVFQNDELVGFIDTKAMTVSGNTTITMPYTHIEADFSSIKEGTLTVNAPNATVKKFKWSVVDSGDDNVIVTLKYKGCTTVDEIKAVDANYKTTDIVDGVWCEWLGDLTDGTSMFNGNTGLISFTSNLSSLTNGLNMFKDCSNLESFSSDLPSLTKGRCMFEYCSKLTSFNSNLSSLTDGYWMFGGTKITSFNDDLSTLTNGQFMFCCPLTSFSSNLSSLRSGSNMFSGCKLDAPSVKNIIDTINTRSSNFTIGMGCNSSTSDKNLFAQEVGYSNMTSLLAALEAKGWTVTAQYNGRPTTTYGLRRPSEDTLPVFVKLEETEDHANYTSMDGSKKFILNYFHETTGSTDGYTQFNSLEEAIEHFNIKPVERN